MSKPINTSRNRWEAVEAAKQDPKHEQKISEKSY
jgi:hypothetical protein